MLHAPVCSAAGEVGRRGMRRSEILHPVFLLYFEAGSVIGVRDLGSWGW